MTPEFLHDELLVVLPGITATRRQCRQGEEFLKEHSQFDVLYIRFGMRWGTERCASHVAQQLVSIQDHYKKIHFLNFIRGGMAFLTFLKDASVPNLGNVIFDRGSAAEQIAKKLSAVFGPLTPIIFGLGVEDVANWEPNHWQWLAPDGCRTGVIIERGISRIARFLKITPHQFVFPECFCYDEFCQIPEIHDDVYTSADFLLKSIQFFETGSFQSCSSDMSGFAHSNT